MSRRTILSRPRTRVYNSNYDIGESYYKSAIDRLDRKYSGRQLSPARQNPTISDDVLERHERAFSNDDLSTARRRAEHHITDNNEFDLKSSRRPLSTAFEADNEYDEEISSKLRKFRAKQNASKLLNDDCENTMNNISYKSMINRTDRMLDSVGLNEKSVSRVLEEEPAAITAIRRRMLKMTNEENDESSDMTKWTAIKDRRETTSAAASRAKQSRARLNDLDDEMEALAERQVARERRAAHLRAIVAENAEETEALQSAMKSTTRVVSMRSEKKSVAF